MLPFFLLGPLIVSFGSEKYANAYIISLYSDLILWHCQPYILIYINKNNNKNKQAPVIHSTHIEKKTDLLFHIFCIFLEKYAIAVYILLILLCNLNHIARHPTFSLLAVTSPLRLFVLFVEYLCFAKHGNGIEWNHF